MNEVKLKGYVQEIGKGYDEMEKMFHYEIKLKEPILKTTKVIAMKFKEENETIDNFTIGKIMYLKGKFQEASMEKNAFNIEWTWFGQTNNLKMNHAPNQNKTNIPDKREEFLNHLKTLGFNKNQIKLWMETYDASKTLKHPLEEKPIEKQIEKSEEKIKNFGMFSKEGNIAIKEITDKLLQDNIQIDTNDLNAYDKHFGILEDQFVEYSDTAVREEIDSYVSEQLHKKDKLKQLRTQAKGNKKSITSSTSLKL